MEGVVGFEDYAFRSGGWHFKNGGHSDGGIPVCHFRIAPVASDGGIGFPVCVDVQGGECEERRCAVRGLFFEPTGAGADRDVGQILALFGRALVFAVYLFSLVFCVIANNRYFRIPVKGIVHLLPTSGVHEMQQMPRWRNR